MVVEQLSRKVATRLESDRIGCDDRIGGESRYRESNTRFKDLNNSFGQQYKVLLSLAKGICYFEKNSN